MWRLTNGFTLTKADTRHKMSSAEGHESLSLISKLTHQVLKLYNLNSKTDSLSFETSQLEFIHRCRGKN